MSPWALVVLAGLLETFWALGLKYSQGFTRPLPSALTVAGALASFWLLSVAMKSLPAGTAYAVWVGIGAVGTVIAGAAFLGEALTAGRVAGVALVVAGLAALKLG